VASPAGHRFCGRRSRSAWREMGPANPVCWGGDGASAARTASRCVTEILRRCQQLEIIRPSTIPNQPRR
jgi:hypothetical protein